MSNIRLFFQESLSLNLISRLDKSQSHYLFKVMRLNIGQTFSLFNESGEWEAKIKDIKKGILEFLVTKKLKPPKNINTFQKWDFHNLLLHQVRGIYVIKLVLLKKLVLRLML